jgi:peptide/nickel transport system substrate-binding protein
MRNKLFLIASLLIIASMVLTACQPSKVVETVVIEKEGEKVVVTATPQAAAAGEFKSKDPTSFVEMTFGEPDTLDPAYDYETAGSNIIQNVYDFLVFYSREKVTELVPMLATELPTLENGGISADGLTYTFKIRQGVKFHNGDELKPSDVAFTLQRGLLQGGTNSPQWLVFEPVMGSTANNDISDLLDPDGSLGLIDNREELAKQDPAKLVETCEKVKSAIVADNEAGTVTIKLAQPWGPFLVTMAGSWAAIQDQKWVGENGGWDGSCDTWQNFYAMTSDELNALPIGSKENGTGPYMLDTWTPTEEIILKANENYWLTEPLWEGGPSGAPALKTIHIKSVDEFSTRFAAFQAGDADYMTAGSPENWPQMDTLVGEVCDNDGNCAASEDAANPIRKYEKLPVINRTDAFFNFELNTEGGNNFMGSGELDGNGIPPTFFSDIHVRKAFAYCFDWETYIRDVQQGKGKQANNVMLFGEIGDSDDTPKYTYDPAKCEEEFKASTWKSKDGKSLWDVGFRMTVGFNTGNTARQTVAQIFQQNISAVNENFVIEVTGLPWPTYLKNYQAKKLPFFIIGWQEDIPDPHNWTFTYTLGAYGGKQRLPQELKDQFTPLVQAGAKEADATKRAEIYKEFNQLFYENVPTILLAQMEWQEYFQRWVNGYYKNPIYGDLYYYALSKQ